MDRVIANHCQPPTCIIGWVIAAFMFIAAAAAAVIAEAEGFIKLLDAAAITAAACFGAKKLSSKVIRI